MCTGYFLDKEGILYQHVKCVDLQIADSTVTCLLFVCEVALSSDTICNKHKPNTLFIKVTQEVIGARLHYTKIMLIHVNTVLIPLQVCNLSFRLT